MRDFENSNESNEMNEKIDNTENKDKKENNENAVNKDTEATQNSENTNSSDERAENDGNSDKQSASYDQTNAPYNPYFRGYSANERHESPYSQNRQQNGGYQNNPYNRQNAQNGQNDGYNPNSYVPRHQYQSPDQNGGQISYTPEKKGRSKKSSSVTTRTLAIVCCAAVILSALGGFGGAMLANKISDRNDQPAVNSTDTPDTNNTVQENVVIYRGVEEVPASVDNTTGEPLTYQQVAAIVKDSVVEIVTEFNTQSMWYQYVTQGAGSGVIISEDGYIITNTHVITDESTGAAADNITVRLTNGEEYTATAIGYDSDEDIAVIKIEAEGLTAAICGNSENIAVGEEIIAVGNPLGELGGTVTNGIVSATEREIQVSGVKMSLIQTNAAVNPGNSGGGMFNMRGELVGIVNAKQSGTGIEGLGFAIPVNRALEITEQLLEFGYVRGKTMIGVSFRDVSNQSSFFYYYSIKEGVYVEALSEGYNDDVLEVGDRIIAVNGNEISSSSDIKAIVMESSVGDKLKFQLYRDGKLKEVEVTCYEQVPASQAEISFESESIQEPVAREDLPSYGFDGQW